MKALNKRKEIIIIILSILPLSYFHILMGQFLIFYNDDALFYTIISKHYFEYGRFTFDTITTTNGFHWGGMFISLFISGIISLITDSESTYLMHLFRYSLLDGIFFSMVIFCSYKLYKLISPAEINIYSKLLFVSIISLVLFKAWGMETLYFSVIVLYYLYKLSFKHTDIYFLAALFFMTLFRYDFAFLVLIITIFWLLKLKQHKNILPLTITFISGFILTGVLNYLAAGSFQSVSSFLKSFGGISQGYISYELIGPGVISYFIIHLVLLTAGVYTYRKTTSGIFLLISLTATMIFIYVNILRVLKGGNIGPWYDIPHLFLAVLNILLFIGNIPIQSSKIRIPILGFLSLSLIILIPIHTTAARFGFEDLRMYDTEEFLDKVKEIVPSESKIAVDDGPGFITYMLNKPVIPLDGLVNSREYAEDYLVKGNVHDYLIKINCSYLLIYENVTHKIENNKMITDVGFRFNPAIPLSRITFQDDQIIRFSDYKKYKYRLLKL